MRSHRLKLERALDHLYALEATVQKWAEHEAWSLVGECEIDSRKHLLRFRLFEPPNDPLIPLLIGDCVHNMRQAIDQLAYRIACKVAGDPPPNEETTGFPVYGSQTELDSALGTKIAAKSKLPAPIYNAIESVQPYHRGDCELLAILHRLDNLDKHRFPPVVAAIARILAFESTGVGSLTMPQTGPVKDHEPVLEFLILPDMEPQVKLEIACSVAFDSRAPTAGGQFVVPTLAAIRQFVLDRVVVPLDALL